MPYREREDLPGFVERETIAFEVSDEPFDRVAFAMRALDLVCPSHTRVAVCPGVRGVHVEAGRAWGRASFERWAMLVVPPRASRRAIAIAVASLAEEHEPWALDVLLHSSGLAP
jgi:hypothetical protein